jgi:hypothetical protein
VKPYTFLLFKEVVLVGEAVVGWIVGEAVGLDVVGTGVGKLRVYVGDSVGDAVGALLGDAVGDGVGTDDVVTNVR